MIELRRNTTNNRVKENERNSCELTPSPLFAPPGLFVRSTKPEQTDHFRSTDLLHHEEAPRRRVAGKPPEGGRDVPEVPARDGPVRHVLDALLAQRRETRLQEHLVTPGLYRKQGLLLVAVEARRAQCRGVEADLQPL